MKNYLHHIDKAGKRFGIYLMDNSSRAELDLFLQSFYNSFGFRPQFNQACFDWFYSANPLGKCNNYILVDLADERWIGAFGFGKKSYQYEAKHITGALAVNGFINPGYEGLGLYTDLIGLGMECEDFSSRMAFSFPHSSNIPSAKGHLKNGWTLFKKLTFLERPVAGVGNNTRATDNEEALARIDFNRLVNSETFSFDRSRDELSWRFLKRPDKKYTLISICNDTSCGYLMLGYYKTREGSMRAQIADYRSTDFGVLASLIGKSHEVAQQQQCQILDVLINMDAKELKCFAALDFKPRAEGYDLLTYAKTKVDLPTDTLVTYGDFDVV